MESSGKISGPSTPVKTQTPNKSNTSRSSRNRENSDPNLTSPNSKSAKKPQKSARKNPNPVASPSPRNKIRDRKFVVARKNLKKEKSNASQGLCKCKINCNLQKCPTVAYEVLRVSQDEFFKRRDVSVVDDCSNKSGNCVQNLEIPNGIVENIVSNECTLNNQLVENAVTSEVGSTNVKRRWDQFSEEVDKSVNDVPKPLPGKVMNLVKAFEQLLTEPKSKDLDDKNENEVEDGEKDVLRVNDTVPQASTYPFCVSDFSITSESLGLDCRVCSSLDSSKGSFTLTSRNSGGGRRSRRNSLESSGTFGGRQWKKRHHRVTSQRPFNLRTEQRGRSKEEEFIKKVQEKMVEEEKQRIPVAQGLPWTTDEPECIVKPPVKESTRPVDLVLHSDLRAVERADFDNQVAEKLSYIEQFKMERERQQKLAEEEEIKRLRRNELIPIAQPMPYFDRPFVPRRSSKDPTIPKEPKFHQLPQHKKIKHYKSRSAVV